MSSFLLKLNYFNIFESKELDKSLTVSKMEIVQKVCISQQKTFLNSNSSKLSAVACKDCGRDFDKSLEEYIRG